MEIMSGDCIIVDESDPPNFGSVHVSSEFQLCIVISTTPYIVVCMYVQSRGQKMMYKEGGYVLRTSYIGPWTPNRGIFLSGLIHPSKVYIIRTSP